MSVAVEMAPHSGFCYGVKRAIDMALETAQNEAGRVVTVGPIIHNPQMVQKLKESGVDCLQTLQDVQDKDCVVVRSHGMVKQDLEFLQKKNVKIVDATCPNVGKIHSLVQDAFLQKEAVVIFGDKEHPEVVAIKSYAHSNSVVAKSIAEVPPEILSAKSVLLVSQTTQNKKLFEQFQQDLQKRCPKLRMVYTICNATQVRQEATQELALRMDVMIVVGGLNSANTRTLAKIASAHCKTHHLETPKDLQTAMVGGFEKIGLTAGASTPSWIIKSTFAKIQSLCSQDTK